MKLGIKMISLYKFNARARVAEVAGVANNMLKFSESRQRNHQAPILESFVSQDADEI
ncbi:MAG: hypothetical protein ACK5L5_10640 [Bacteroidales bacterium]